MGNDNTMYGSNHATDNDIRALTADDEIANQETANLDDDQTPFSTPDDQLGTLPQDHPSTDSNIDPQETYDEAIGGAAEARDPLLDEHTDIL